MKIKEVKEEGAKWVNKQLAELLEKVNQTVRKREKIPTINVKNLLAQTRVIKIMDS